MPGIMCEKNELQKAWMSFLYSLFELSCYDSLLYPLGAISDMEMQEHYDEFFEVKPHHFAAGTLSFTKG